MSRQEGACWRCGAPWVADDGPRAELRVIAGGGGSEAARIAIAVAAAQKA